MSANVYWEPIKPTKNRDLDVSAPSSFIDAMKRAFDEGPWELNQSSVSKVEGMAAAYHFKPNPYDEILTLLAKHERIRIWAEY